MVEEEYRVKALERFESKVDFKGPFCKKLKSRCWLWNAGLQHQGYGIFRYLKDTMPAHRAALMFWCDVEFGEGEQANHLCRNKNCVRPEHLYVGSQFDNVHDSIDDGTFHQLKITRTHLMDIIQMLNDGVDTEEIIRIYSIKKKWKRKTK